MIDTAIILAVGHPAHYSQFAYNRSQTMLPALGKPLVVRAMDQLYRSANIRKFIVIVGENEGSVAAFLNTKWMSNIQVQFIVKVGSQTLAKILATAIQQCDTQPLIAGYNCFGHSMFPARLIHQFNADPDALVISGATRNLSRSNTHRYGVLDGDTVVDIVDQPNLENLILMDVVAASEDFCLYLRELPQRHPHCDTFMDIIRRYLQDGGRANVARTNWLLQIQDDIDLLTLNQHLLDEKIDAHILSELPYTVQIREPVRIDPRVSIGQGAIIGPYVYLEQGCTVGRQAVVRNAIVLERANVMAQETVENTILSTRKRIQA